MIDLEFTYRSSCGRTLSIVETDPCVVFVVVVAIEAGTYQAINHEQHKVGGWSD